jgi:hypothetical protein
VSIVSAPLTRWPRGTLTPELNTVEADTTLILIDS